MTAESKSRHKWIFLLFLLNFFALNFEVEADVFNNHVLKKLKGSDVHLFVHASTIAQVSTVNGTIIHCWIEAIR